MVVGTEIGDKKSLNFSFLKRLVEREGLPVSAKGSHEALQNWSSHTSFWFTSNYLVPFWQDDAMSQKVNLWTFDHIFDAEPIGFQEQATDQRIKAGRVPRADAVAGFRHGPHPAQARESGQPTPPSSSRDERRRGPLAKGDQCAPREVDGVHLQVLRALLQERGHQHRAFQGRSRPLPRLLERGGGRDHGTKGLARGRRKPRGLRERNQRQSGRMKRGDSVTALQLTAEGVQRFCQTESIPDLQWENKMVDPLAEKLQKVFGA